MQDNRLVLGMAVITIAALVLCAWFYSQADINIKENTSCNCHTNYTCACEVVQKTVTPGGFAISDYNIKGSHLDLNINPIVAYADDWGILSGVSMEPSIFHGNTVMSNRVDENYEFKAGMIIRYSRNPCGDPIDPIIHRILAVYNGYLLVKGDNTYVIEKVQRCQVTHVIIGILFT